MFSFTQSKRIPLTTLKEKIDQYKKASAGKATEEMVAIMKSATQAVNDSVSSRAIPKKGAPLPAFNLIGSDGSNIESGKLLESGPLVISFFRGMW